MNVPSSGGCPRHESEVVEATSGGARANDGAYTMTTPQKYERIRRVDLGPSACSLWLVPHRAVRDPRSTAVGSYVLLPGRRGLPILA
jgi:hypothetical protein